MLKTIKAVAMVMAIATAATAVVVFGMFIGGLLLFLGAVAGVALILWFLWCVLTEHRSEKRGGE